MFNFGKYKKESKFAADYFESLVEYSMNFGENDADVWNSINELMNNDKQAFVHEFLVLQL